jgi:transposase
MSHLFWLSDEAWSIIEPLLPSNQPGARRVDDRRVISGILYVLRTGCPWRSCPAEYGPSTTIYNRFNRWSRRGVWQKIYEVLAAEARIGGTVAIDSTYVKAHRSARPPRPAGRVSSRDRIDGLLAIDGAKKKSRKIRRLAYPGAAGARRSTSP